MSKGNATENDLMKFFFNLDAMPAYGAVLYLSLHTSDPGEGGDQTSNEVTVGEYTSYLRIGVSRDAAGWSVVDNQSSNIALLQFPKCTGGTGATLTHIAIGTLAAGAGQILYSGILDAPLNVSNLVQPQFAIGGLVVQED
jgi:hypothetical protein